MLPSESAPLLYRELQRIATHATWSERERVMALSGLMERIFFEATRREQFAFSTLFARISYAGHKFRFGEQELRSAQYFRLAAKRVRNGAPAREQMVRLGLQAIAASVRTLTGVEIPEAFSDLHFADSYSEVTRPPSEPAREVVRAVLLEDCPESGYFVANDEEFPDRNIRVWYDLPERNENFAPSIRIIRKVFGFPVTVNLLEVQIDAEGDYRPRAFVIEPDYLVDVSAVSECFKDTGADPYAYLVKKFLPYETTEPILLGNIANFFLDRLLNEPDAVWADTFRETFQLYPFVYAPMSDAAVKSVSAKAQKHFVNLKSMVASGLAKEGIEPGGCFLEPTFFSERYGIQGRLDLFYHSPEKAAIVELKSGSPFKPNSYGIQRSHFTQTLLYDLLVRSVYGPSVDPAKYILYSGVELNHLRFAPTVQAEQWEALQLRNHLIAIERLLMQIKPGDLAIPVLDRLRAIHGKGFSERDFGRFESAYSTMSDLERKYFNAFAGFAAREHWLAKAGQEGADLAGGHAALWRSSFDDKQQGFSILSHLELVENRADQADPFIRFRRTAHTHPLANFRTGDIAVLYPMEDEHDSILRHQVIKCTITELGREFVTVQLRFRQHNLNPFETTGYWCLEPDLMDSGFAAMYRGLLEWAEAGKAKRAMLLGELGAGEPEAPFDPSPTGRGGASDLALHDRHSQTIVVDATSPLPVEEGTGVGSDEQTHQKNNTASSKLTHPPGAANLLSRITNSRDYFLLWGPPGTGKTSVMLRDLTAWILNETGDNLLLLAYTNRAVDEICESLDSIGGDIRSQYLRIGARYSTEERFRGQLLNTKIAGVANRAALRQILEQHRIFVSTVASFSQNEGLLKLKKFQRLIVDEASQILEPQLIGLLTRFDHFVLIGDHRQLPAVTTQAAENTVVQDEALNGLGLYDLRDSYFERLYRRCMDQGWHWAYGQLDRQGRMHETIMDFPNRYFYEGKLQTLSPESAHHQKQSLAYKAMANADTIGDVLCSHRVVFFPVNGEADSPGRKTSQPEAALAARIVAFFKNLWETNGKTWHPAKTLGIITPWRAQIAQIRESLTLAGIDPDTITIDTVERYQGGARDIIIVSTCVHSAHQLNSLVSMGDGGVDRKMNVALTRAREHLIMIGNEEILRSDARYRAFIEQYACR